jgi:hypothetical protein
MPFLPLGICERYPKWAVAAWRSSQGCTTLKVAEVVVRAPRSHSTSPGEMPLWIMAAQHRNYKAHTSSAMHARATYQGHRIAAHGISAIWAYAPFHNRRGSCTTRNQIAGVYALCSFETLLRVSMRDSRTGQTAVSRLASQQTPPCNVRKRS